MPEPRPQVSVTVPPSYLGTSARGSGTIPAGPVAPSPQARQVLRPLHHDAVTLDRSGLLGWWQQRNTEATLPHCVAQLEAGGALGNLRRVAGDGRPHAGMWFSDSDVYKTLEAIAWQLPQSPQDDELWVLESVTDVLEAAQEEDGYLNSYFQHVSSSRWQELATSHELYCAGHLIQAAVAAHRAGVGERLMAIACRFADLIVARFGPGGHEGVCGHPEIETALVELYRSTGHEPYLSTARRFIDLRGRGLLGAGQFGAAYFQDHVPVRDAEEFTGHAVRQLYLLAGAVDVAVETGDEALLAATQRLWDSAFGAKTYITGAHGSRHRDEAVGDPYELPPDRAYAETCAAIGSFQWNWRLLLATGGHRYAEEMERVLYNAIAGSTAVDGRHFFYSNPLQVRSGHDGSGEDTASQRRPWYSCACCPPNLARLIGSLRCYLATSDDSGLQIHQYTAASIRSGHRRVDIDTGYPWDGGITLNVSSAGDEPWTLALRVPAWCAGDTLAIDGLPVDAAPADGYIRLTRVWSGQAVALRLPMPARLLAAHPRVDAVRGCVAMARGPLVYSIEQADLPATTLEDVVLDAAAPVHVTQHEATSVIPVSLTAQGRADHRPSAPLYSPHGSGNGAVTSTPITVTAVPYFLWGNRRPGPMRVFIPAADRSAPSGPPSD